MLSIGLSLTSVAVRGGGGQVSAAALMLASESQGLALDFTDDAFLSSTGIYGSARVKDTGTPANEYDSHPFGLVSYGSPSPKLCLGPEGTLRYGAHNLYLNSEAPANQSVTVVSGMTYQITVTGSVSITVSGAATGTVTDGNPISFTAATTTLTCGSTSGSGTVHLRRLPSDDTYLKTTSAAVYELPYEWDSALDGEGNRPLLGIIKPEPQRTNLFLWSREFGNSYWAKTQATVDDNAGIAPDGTLTADKLVETVVNSQHRVTRFLRGVANDVYTASVFLKAGERSFARVINYDSGSNYYGLRVNLTDGSATVVSVGSVTSASAIVEPFLNGWYRVSVTAAYSATTKGLTVNVMSSASSDTYAGDGTSGIYIWHGQLEPGSFRTSPIETVDSTVTRAADVFGPALAAFPWNGGDGIYEVDGVAETPTNNGTILTLAAPSGDTHISTVKWVPAA